MKIDESLADALEDLELDTNEVTEEPVEDALTEGYGMVEGGASITCFCTCSCCC